MGAPMQEKGGGCGTGALEMGQCPAALLTPYLDFLAALDIATPATDSQPP